MESKNTFPGYMLIEYGIGLTLTKAPFQINVLNCAKRCKERKVYRVLLSLKPRDSYQRNCRELKCADLKVRGIFKQGKDIESK